MSETPVIPLPDSYSWGFVVARSIHAMADSIEDEDRFPEARGSNGRVTFTPRIRFNKHTEDPTAFVQHEIITARIVRGELRDAEDYVGIYLISGVYTVSFTIEGGSIPSFDIEVLPTHTKENPLDLVLAAPYEPPPGVIVNTLDLPSNGEENEFLGWRNGRLVWVKSAMGTDSAVDEVLSDPTSKSYLRFMSTFEELGITIDTSVGTRVFVSGIMIHGTTGWRDLIPLFPGATGKMNIARDGNVVEFQINALDTSEVEEGHEIEMPVGFRVANTTHTIKSGSPLIWTLHSGRFTLPNARYAGSFHSTWITDDPWPTTLPGTPA